MKTERLKMARSKKTATVKPKRPGPAPRTSKLPQVVVDLSGFGSTYKAPQPRRHRGPSTAGAVPNLKKGGGKKG